MMTHDESVIESSDEDLGVQRFLLDLALQPLNEWRGYDHIEQLGGSALRYQLNSIGYALALAQLTRTPAFTGYLAEAQRNAIRRMCDRRVWGYWAIENLVGYGRWNPDPIEWNNVMYTAYFGMMLGLYETLNDDPLFSQPGALPLHWKGDKVFHYDFQRIAEAIQRNMLARPHSPQYPCEPHLIYPMCNTFAFNSLLMHDRLHGSAFTGDLVDRVRNVYHQDGWRRQDGRWVPGRIENTRIQILPTSIAHDAVMAFWLHAAMPDLGSATWQMLRERFLPVRDGRLALHGQWWDRVDFGNYNLARGDTFTRAMLMHTARELGDETVAQSIEQSLEQRRRILWQYGARRFANVSVMGNGIYAMARFGRASGMADLIHGRIPDAWRHGPLLVDAAYPDVLVARAVSDGAGLSLVLKPGMQPVSTHLGLARLQPGRRYRVLGAEQGQIQADTQGKATLPITLQQRLALEITPVE